MMPTSQSHRIVSTLKRLLKARGISYKGVASRLNLSESSVKRIFARRDFTLERLETICEMAGTDLFGLWELAGEREAHNRYHLTVVQEEALAADHRLFVFFHLLLRGDSVAKIQKGHQVSEALATRFLVALDRLKLIELFPGNRVRLLVPRLVRWITDGPLAEKYVPALKQEFFDSPFTGSDEYIRLLRARMTRSTRELIHRKVTDLVHELEELVDSQPHELSAEPAPFAVLLAYRPLNLKVSFTRPKPRR